ncbi:hypothetical protein [Streptomyces sp. NBC_01615]|uniref:hypothetical protein n=1 Tax=Streptomyces sp. NBC_01615 TaxID=2975898 RepID=UPI00386A7859
MRPPASPASRISRGLLVPTAVRTALVFGPVGTAAAAIDVPGTASAGTTAAWASADSDAVLEQLGVLDEGMTRPA